MSRIFPMIAVVVMSLLLVDVSAASGSDDEVSVVAVAVERGHGFRGEYLVELSDTAPVGVREALRARGIYVDVEQVDRIAGRVFRGAVVELSGWEAQEAARSRFIATVTPNLTVQVNAPEKSSLLTASATTPWNLSRVNQRKLPLDGSYRPFAQGNGVHVYIVDSGVNVSLPEFAGRAGRGVVIPSAGSSPDDCNGHGTHVAGTVGSSSYGVATGVTLHSVRVLNCAGSGTIADVVSGLNWVAANVERPAIVNASLGVPGRYEALDGVVEDLRAMGILMVVAAGNDGGNSCNFSFAGSPGVITVGATSQTDAATEFSNSGSCLDVWAPGDQIPSVSLIGGTSIRSGTSMTAPAVTGVAAILWSQNPSLGPVDIERSIAETATKNVVDESLSAQPSPNKMVYVARDLTKPSKVKKLKIAKVTSTTVKAVWKQPKDTGGTAIKKYQTRIKKGSSWTSWKSQKPKAGKKGKFTKAWDGLKSGKTVVVHVRAKNSQGAGPAVKVKATTKR
jgi:subtilisin family serine protease